MKKLFVFISILVIIVITFVSVRNFSTVEEVNQDNGGLVEQTLTVEDTNDSDDTDVYTISSGSQISYTVQKEFFSKPTEPVTGTTNDVTGELSINSEDKTISIKAAVNPLSLDSGSRARDSEVRGEFDGRILVELENFKFENSENVSFTAPVKLTINGVSKALDFTIIGSISSEELIFKGSSSINMTDFNVNPPSILGIYSVNDVAVVSFDLILN